MQLWIGIELLFINQSYDDYQHLVPSGWTTNLWEYMSSQQILLDTTKQFTQSLQRTNDVFLMDIVNSHFSPQQATKLNRIRISPKLLTLSDVANIRRKVVLQNTKNLQNNRQSSLLWPLQPVSKKNRKLWIEACTIFQ